MRQPGIEPGPTAWKAMIIPLEHWRLSETENQYI